MCKGLTRYRLSCELYRMERTIASDKAGDKYLALRRYYFDILISPLLEILFESGVRSAQSKLSWYIYHSRRETLIDIYRTD